MHVRGCTPMWVHVETTDWQHVFLTHSLPQFFLRQSLTEPGACSFCKAGWPQSPCYLLSLLLGLQIPHLPQMHEQQSCYSRSHSPGSRFLLGIVFTNTSLLTLWELRIYSSTLNWRRLTWPTAVGTLLALLWIVLSCSAHSPTLKANLHSHPNEGFLWVRLMTW